MAMTDPLVSTQWLADHLADPDLHILDGSWWLPGEQRSGHAEYLDAHIPGAVFFDIDALSDHSSDLPHMALSPAAFALAGSRLGLSRAGTTVVYDTFGIRAAARVWWNLRLMGFDKVFVLDGGLKTWRVEGRSLETGERVPTALRLTPSFNPNLIRDASEVSAILSDGSAQMVDARGAARFRGDAPEPRPGLKSGHMPGARNVPFDSLLSPDGRMKSAAELRQIFDAKHVDLDRPIVTTCGSGVTACVIALALARLGYADVPVYDGSWSEWGGREGAAIEVG
jgi:thiosulfate/3-mercaptopyruvate sulfurtransferase